MGEERNAYIHLFLCLVLYGTRGKFPSFTCKGSSWLFWRCSFMLMSIFNSTVESIPYQSNNMWQARQCRGLFHDQSESVGFGVCWSSIEVRLAVWLQWESLQTKTAQYWNKNRNLTQVNWKMKTFLLTVTVTQMTLLTQTSHSGLRFPFDHNAFEINWTDRNFGKLLTVLMLVVWDWINVYSVIYVLYFLVEN